MCLKTQAGSIVKWLLILLASTPVFSQRYPEMIAIDSGSFWMGSEPGMGNADERPQRFVSINNFQIAKTETTVGQWKTFCEATGRQMPVLPAWVKADSFPIINITWTDAVAYTEWLSEKTGKKYRLPTEAEWEFAARGGNQSKCVKYSGSAVAESVAWFDAHGKMAHPVAQKRPNELGLYDMSGNAGEWCLDWYGPYSKSPLVDNPTGPPTGYAKVLRGGSWGRTAMECTVAFRGRYAPDFRDERNGFRVVMEGSGRD